MQLVKERNVRRWYAGFLCFGKAATIVQHVGMAIHNLNLSTTIPVMRVQKNPPKDGFYLFLGIESEVEGVFPPEAAPLLKLSYLQSRRPGPLQLDEIRKMVGAEMDVHDYTSRIPFRVTVRDPLEDPFGPNTMLVVDDAQVTYTVEKSHLYDRLLLWLSAAGDGSWATFRGACRALGLDSNKSGAAQILRRLRLLGHLETSSDGSRWCVAPTVLARPAYGTGDDTYFLCGRRDERLLAALYASADEVEVAPQRNSNAPCTIRVVVRDVAAVTPCLAASESSYSLRAGGTIAERLAGVLPPLTQWVDMLQSIPGIKPYMYRVRRFDVSSGAFVDTALADSTGLYELWPRDTAFGAMERPDLILFYDKERDRWLRGDWYGLRFLAQYASGRRCPVAYDNATGRLAISKDWIWPQLYERALVLASGRLPDTNARLYYDSISPGLLDTLEQKLNLRCERN